MELRDVHEMVHDKARNQSTLARINPTRSYYRGSAGGILNVTWQNGHWFGPDRREIPEADIPADVLAELKAHPVLVESEGPEVTKVCSLCKATVNSSQLEAHLYDHIRSLGTDAGLTATADAEKPMVVGPIRKSTVIESVTVEPAGAPAL